MQSVIVHQTHANARVGFYQNSASTKSALVYPHSLEIILYTSVINKAIKLTQLIWFALNVSGTIRPMNRVRLRVCAHLVGRGLLEPVKPDHCLDAGRYPEIVPTVQYGASLRLTEAGRRAVLQLEVKDYGDYFPVAADVERAQAKCEGMA